MSRIVLREFTEHENWLAELHRDFIAWFQITHDGAARERLLHVAVAGGQSPLPYYSRLATDPSAAAWMRHIVWWLGDERWVPVADADRNETAIRACFERVPDLRLVGWRDPTAPRRRVDEGALEPGDPNAAARHMAQRLQTELPAEDRGRPCFDLALLGVGADGHTASLFPQDADAGQIRGEAGAQVPNPNEALTLVARHPETGQTRLSLSYSVLESSHQVWFVADGAGKEPMIRRMAGGDSSFPAGRIAVHVPARIYFCHR